jgi:hypothetical protein
MKADEGMKDATSLRFVVFWAWSILAWPLTYAIASYVIKHARIAEWRAFNEAQTSMGRTLILVPEMSRMTAAKVLIEWIRSLPVRMGVA